MKLNCRTPSIIATAVFLLAAQAISAQYPIGTSEKDSVAFSGKGWEIRLKFAGRQVKSSTDASTWIYFFIDIDNSNCCRWPILANLNGEIGGVPFERTIKIPDPNGEVSSTPIDNPEEFLTNPMKALPIDGTVPIRSQYNAELGEGEVTNLRISLVGAFVPAETAEVYPVFSGLVIKSDCLEDFQRGSPLTGMARRKFLADFVTLGCGHFVETEPISLVPSRDKTIKGVHYRCAIIDTSISFLGPGEVERQSRRPFVMVRPNDLTSAYPIKLNVPPGPPKK